MACTTIAATVVLVAFSIIVPVCVIALLIGMLCCTEHESSMPMGIKAELEDRSIAVIRWIVELE